MTDQPVPPALDRHYEMAEKQATVIDPDGAHTVQLTSFTLGYSPWIVLVVDAVSPAGVPNFVVKWGGMSRDEAQQAVRALAISLSGSQAEDEPSDDG